MNNIDNRLIVALDAPSLDTATKVVKTLAGTVAWFKIGKQLFTSVGPAAVSMVKERGGKIFLDLKFHDIPATVAGAGVAATELGVDMFNVHATGGFEMMKRTVDTVNEHCDKKGINPPIMIAVTVLTSMDRYDLSRVGINAEPADQVVKLAKLAKEAGMKGVVASTLEITIIKEEVGEEFLVITPGVRPAGSSMDDQKRIMLPKEAIRKGADFIVVGRPILKADDPVTAARNITIEMGRA